MPEDKNIKHINGKSMTASEYYYECKPDTWDNMLYPAALKDRHDRIQKLYFKLTEEDLKGTKWSFDERVRYHKVEKAYKDAKQLLDERTLII